MGIFGYITFGVAVDGNVFNNFTDEDDAFIGAAKLALGLTLAFSTPLFVYPTRELIISLVYRRPMPFAWFRHSLVTAGLISFTLVMAILIPSVEDVFALSGATTGTCSVYILPTLFFLRSGHLAPNTVNTSPLWRAGAWGLLAFGAVSGLAATATVLLDITGAVSAK